MSCDDAGTKLVRRVEVFTGATCRCDWSDWLTGTLTRLSAAHRAIALEQLKPWNFARGVT